MPLLLSESAKLTLDQLALGVVETIIEDSPMAGVLPFIQVEGNSYKWNKELALGGASFYAVNAVWTEGAATFTQASNNLAILGGDADVDNFIQRSRSNMQDQRAIQTVLKAKDVARKWETTLLTGDTATDANAFDGLRKMMPTTANAQVITPAAAGGPLTLALLDQLIDLVKGGKPHALVMSKRTRRKLKSLLQASAHYVESGETAFGRQVMLYDGIPVVVSDFQPDNETADNGTRNSFSSIYAIQFSEADGLCGLQNGMMEAVDIGQLETKDAQRVRIRWYVSLALKRESAAARMNGVSAA